MARDYYAVLEVSAGATPVQVRRAYQRLARQYSPDVNIWDRDAHALFEEIVEAYRVLSDPTARAVYDRVGGQVRQRSDRAGATPTAARRGDDAHVAVELSLAQAASGVSIDVPVERLAPCATCAATGGRPGAPSVACEHCGGAGTVWYGSGALMEGSCPACGGAGRRVIEPCPDCRGRGVRPERTAVPALIPAGVDTGAQIHLPGEGHAGPFGGPRGALVIMIRVHDDPAFVRKGDNLHTELGVTVPEAVLGARLPVRTLEGEADIVVPPGTQNGQVLRLRGRGLPRPAAEGRGDLHVTVRVEIPRGIDARTQELFRELGRLLPRQQARP